MSNRMSWNIGAAFALGVALSLAGCSAADVAGTSCADSEDCPRGQICGTGTCEEAGCTDDGDCADGEACLFVDGDGLFDADAEGVCSAVECGERPLPSCQRGEECIDGICYEVVDDGSCDCSDDCERGEVCFEGACSEPLGVCSDDCECPVGSTCGGDGTCLEAADPCDGVTCTDGQTCVDGECQSAGCDPACGDGQTCVDGVCQSGSGGGLCSSCTADADCGGGNNLCVTLNDGAGGTFQYCGTECSVNSDCPVGFTCFAAVAGRPSQCRPVTNSCDGCLGTGCADGQFCNPAGEGGPTCVTETPTCGECNVDVQCGSGARCTPFAGGNFCLDECASQADCESDEQCRNAGGNLVCTPLANSCGGTSCAIPPESCTGDTPVLNADLCRCVGCGADSDCDAGQTCSTADGQCIVAGAPCTRITDCPAGICDTRIGRCVECITSGDCPSGEICARGLCEPCACPAGQLCDINGECVAGGDPGDCTSDSECQTLAAELGYVGATAAACDSGPGGVGCFIPGLCNGDIGSVLGGGGGLPIPGLGDLGTGGDVDPFNAPCPSGLTCQVSFDLLGGLLGGGGGSVLKLACGTCDESDPEACRGAESCSAPLFDIGGTGPQCVAGGGGGGFPFPFP